MLFHSLLSGRALAAVIVSFLAGLVTLMLVYGRRYEPARYCGAIAVAAIVAGWALARWPTILPGLTVYQAAAGHDTLVWVIVVVLGGGAIVAGQHLENLSRLETLLSERANAIRSAPEDGGVLRKLRVLAS
jgi:DMSO reductase anchor subunit